MGPHILSPIESLDWVDEYFYIIGASSGAIDVSYWNISLLLTMYLSNVESLPLLLVILPPFFIEQCSSENFRLSIVIGGVPGVK